MPTRLHARGDPCRWGQQGYRPAGRGRSRRAGERRRWILRTRPCSSRRLASGRDEAIEW